jgi:hypothetical protein
MGISNQKRRRPEMTNYTLSESSFSHIINAPIGRVDIADWLFKWTSCNRDMDTEEHW